MLYTIGELNSTIAALTHALRTERLLFKKGMRETDPGGTVFLSPRDARRFMNDSGIEGWSIFELDADWEVHCYQANESDYWRHLLADRPITRLVEG